MPDRWVLLRGLSRSAWHWGAFGEALRESGLASDVMALDLPGVGTEQHRRSPLSVEEIAEDVRARWLGGAQGGGWRILGVSMGAMVAMAWCKRYPEDFRGAALLNSSARNLGASWERFSTKALPRVLTALVSGDAARRERTVLDITVNDPALRARHLEPWTQYAALHPVARSTFLAQIGAAARFSAPERLGLPTLVLASRRDRLVSSACSERLAARLRANLVVHPWAGHDLALDDPRWLLRELTIWSRTPATFAW